MTITEEQGPSGSMHLQLQRIPWGPHAPLLQTCWGEQGLEGKEEDGGRRMATACTTKHL